MKDKDNFIYTRHIDKQRSSLRKCTCVYDLNPTYSRKLPYSDLPNSKSVTIQMQALNKYLTIIHRRWGE